MPCFRLLTLVTGKGTFHRRQEYFVQFAKSRTTPLIKIAMEQMEVKIAKNIDGFRQSLDAIWDDGLAKIDNQIDAICQRIVQEEQGHETAVDSGGGSAELEFRKGATPLIIKWHADWKLPDMMGRMQAGKVDTTIPQTYIAEPMEQILDPPSSDGEGWDYQPQPQPQPPKRKRTYVRKADRAKNDDERQPKASRKRAPVRKCKTEGF